MTTTDPGEDFAIAQTEAELQALDVAMQLIDAGVPVFYAEADADPTGGTGGSGYWLPPQWQMTTAHPDALDRVGRCGSSFRLGRDALCAVMGQGLDLIDIDPRHGGDVAIAAHEDQMPTVYGSATTPSGGEHRFVASIGINSKDGFLPGVDFKGGTPEGQGRGYAFIAPTVRRSKTTGAMVAYSWHTPPANFRDGDDTGSDLRDLVKIGSPSPAATAVSDGISEGESVSAGGRDIAAASEAWRLAKEGCSRKTARRAMETFWTHLEQPEGDPFPLADALAKIDPAFDKVEAEGDLEAEIAKAQRLEEIRDQARERHAAAKAAKRLEGMVEKMQAKTLTFAQALALPPQPYLLEGLIPGPGITLLTADPGVGKSFLMLDIACHVASGADSWFGLDLTPGHAAYVVAEGASGLGQRTKAWQSEHPGSTIDDATLTLFHDALDLSIPGSGDVLVEWLEWRQVEDLRLLVIDTLRRVSGDLNENLAEIGRVFDNLRPVIEAHPDAAIVVVHHNNRGGSFSGNTALKGNADALLTMTKTNDRLISTLAAEKQKDAAGDSTLEIRYAIVDAGTDAKDKPVTSRVVRSVRERINAEAIEQTLTAPGLVARDWLVGTSEQSAAVSIGQAFRQKDLPLKQSDRTRAASELKAAGYARVAGGDEKGRAPGNWLVRTDPKRGRDD